MGNQYDTWRATVNTMQSTDIAAEQSRRSFCIDSILKDCQKITPSRATPPSTPPTPPSSSPPSFPALPRPLFAAPLPAAYSYPGTGLFPALPPVGGGSSSPPTSAAFDTVLKAQGNAAMQTMQLEWLARTGMLYHRFPELAGREK